MIIDPNKKYSLEELKQEFSICSVCNGKLFPGWVEENFGNMIAWVNCGLCNIDINMMSFNNNEFQLEYIIFGEETDEYCMVLHTPPGPGIYITSKQVYKKITDYNIIDIKALYKLYNNLDKLKILL